MHIRHLWLQHFRNYESAEVDLPPSGLTVIGGVNGQGKTNLLEAIGFVAMLRSFRAAGTDALVQSGAETAVVRGEGDREGRNLLVESELHLTGRNRVLVNKQAAQRRDRSERFLATFFAPDDLELVKGSPSQRRDYLDDVLKDSDPRLEAVLTDVDRALRQRNALLRSASGRLTAEVALTLDVWDQRFAEAGQRLGMARRRLIDRLEPIANERYQALTTGTSRPERLELNLQSDWFSADQPGALADALLESRSGDVARGVTTRGPHRDDIVILLNGLPARAQASQGEQRSIALALRLATHHLLAELAGSEPLLLLDDVFSELDDRRTAALLSLLPAAQTFLTTATEPPSGTRPAAWIDVDAGKASVR